MLIYNAIVSSNLCLLVWLQFLIKYFAWSVFNLNVHTMYPLFAVGGDTTFYVGPFYFEEVASQTWYHSVSSYTVKGLEMVGWHGQNEYLEKRSKRFFNSQKIRYKRGVKKDAHCVWSSRIQIKGARLSVETKMKL